MTSRLNRPGMGGGRLLPSVVVTTLTCWPPCAKALYCPPGIDAILFPHKLSIQSNARRMMISRWNKKRIACLFDAFRFQFNSVARRYFITTQTVLLENASLISRETETEGAHPTTDRVRWPPV